MKRNAESDWEAAKAAQAALQGESRAISPVYRTKQQSWFTYNTVVTGLVVLGALFLLLALTAGTPLPWMFGVFIAMPIVGIAMIPIKVGIIRYRRNR